MAEAIVEGTACFATPGTSDGVVNLFGNASVPANHKYTLEQVWLINTTGSPASITLARNGTAVTAGNQLCPTISVPANSIEYLPKLVFETGDSFHALQGTSGAINIYAPGADHTLT